MTQLISIDTLRNNAANARAQAKQHENNMNAALGAAQAYEQLLSALLVAQKEEKAKAEADLLRAKDLAVPSKAFIEHLNKEVDKVVIESKEKAKEA